MWWKKQKPVVLDITAEIQEEVNKNMDEFMQEKSLRATLEEELKQVKAVVTGIIKAFEDNVPKPDYPKGAVIPLRNGKWSYIVMGEPVVTTPHLENSGYMRPSYYSDNDIITSLQRDISTLKNFKPKWHLPKKIPIRGEYEEYEDYGSALYALSIVLNPEKLTTYFDEDMNEVVYEPE